MHFLLNLSHCVKSYGHFCQILAFFTMPAPQIWSFHVPQEANFEHFLICPNFTFSIRKSHKISIGKALYFRSYQPITSRGGGVENTLPSAFRVKRYKRRQLCFGRGPRYPYNGWGAKISPPPLSLTLPFDVWQQWNFLGIEHRPRTFQKNKK